MRQGGAPVPRPAALRGVAPHTDLYISQSPKRSAWRGRGQQGPATCFTGGSGPRCPPLNGGVVPTQSLVSAHQFPMTRKAVRKRYEQPASQTNKGRTEVSAGNGNGAKPTTGAYRRAITCPLWPKQLSLRCRQGPPSSVSAKRMSLVAGWLSPSVVTRALHVHKPASG